MEAKMRQLGEFTIVHLSGKLNLEKNQPFRDVCLKTLSDKRVVFCLDGLQFVGSSGIQSFFRTLSEIHGGNRFGIKISGLTADFVRIFQYTAVSGLEVHENLDNAMRSFSSPVAALSLLETPTPIQSDDEFSNGNPTDAA